ncbi:PREDICTED: uncharacterized protein LOC106749014 isoform X1 [Dinoponera quadriceps]|uniref:Uncharacterized protein LOC106749014 isoform X1 n=1 Tax=Dinoponera quadriceps TaxID=609295 RepID=A0A6P3XZM0_DINQU|nr:PREDICTED: uncharacterized protein LOC106749014 isoform X1 [Dinoponera quadriceps]
MSGEQFSLVWNSFPRNLSSGLYTLLTDEQLVDVTLAAEGQILRAHKLILSVCSTYFRELFKMNSCKHPIVILKDISYRDLSSMLHFMYQGEVNIKQEDISSFLKVAETLQIKGLTAGTDEKFSDTLEGKKDWKDLDFYLDKDEDNPGHTDGHSFRHTVEKEQSTTRQNVSAEGSKEGRPFTEGVGDVSHRQIHTEPGDYNLLPDIQATYSERCASADASSGNVEPLDCTSSDVSQLQSTKHEPLDYTLDTDIDAEYNRTCMVEKVLYNSEENAQRQDFAPDTQLVPYSQNSQIQPFGTFFSTSLPHFACYLSLRPFLYLFLSFFYSSARTFEREPTHGTCSCRARRSEYRRFGHFCVSVFTDCLFSRRRFFQLFLSRSRDFTFSRHVSVLALILNIVLQMRINDPFRFISLFSSHIRIYTHPFSMFLILCKLPIVSSSHNWTTRSLCL